MMMMIVKKKNDRHTFLFENKHFRFELEIEKVRFQRATVVDISDRDENRSSFVKLRSSAGVYKHFDLLLRFLLLNEQPPVSMVVRD